MRASTRSTTRAIVSMAALRWGSLLSSGAVKGFGYHVLPAAWGAR